MTGATSAVSLMVLVSPPKGGGIRERNGVFRDESAAERLAHTLSSFAFCKALLWSTNIFRQINASRTSWTEA